MNVMMLRWTPGSDCVHRFHVMHEFDISGDIRPSGVYALVGAGLGCEHFCEAFSYFGCDGLTQVSREFRGGTLRDCFIRGDDTGIN